jgi:tRNA G37 N-methylase Trm5
VRLELFELGSDFMQKNKGITTVVNKLDSIDTKFRFFKMELIAGEPNYVVEHVSTLLPYFFLLLTDEQI